MTTTPAPGDFQLVPTGGDTGRLIRLGQWLNGDGFADYEHVRLYIGDGWFVEAMPGGARRAAYPLDQGLWSTGHFPMTWGQQTMVTAVATHLIGTPYSGMDYLALAAHRLHIPVPDLKNYIASTGHMICSQLVDYCYLMAGVHLFNDGRWPGYVTPAALADLLRKP